MDELLRHPRIQAQLKNHPKALIVRCIRKILEEKRTFILQSRDGGPVTVARSPENWLAGVENELTAALRPSLRPVINATGVVLHTNLGRAPLSEEALKNVVNIGRGYANLELDLRTGERSSRYEHVEERLCRLSGAESALVVNNNAAAVLLALNSLAEGKEVIVSRGQLVEIGGSFRIPDIMKKSGARLMEVGTTNRTHLQDYEGALSERTALLLRVHTSNFRVMGYTADVSLKDLVSLGQARGLPVMEDLGSGCFLGLEEYGWYPEATVPEVLAAGPDVVTFSGDKLLGGPQAGIILGKGKFIGLLRKNPLHRAVRIDKLTLAALESTLRVYEDDPQPAQKIPVLGMLTCGVEKLERRAKRLKRILAKELSLICRVNLREESSQVGGGAMPLQALPTRVVALHPLQISAATLEERLRQGDPPVVARIKEEEILLDLRTVSIQEEEALIGRVRQALS